MAPEQSTGPVGARVGDPPAGSRLTARAVAPCMPRAGGEKIRLDARRILADARAISQPGGSVIPGAGHYLRQSIRHPDILRL